MAPTSRNRTAVVWVMRMGGGNKGMIDACTHKQVKESLVYAKPRPYDRVTRWLFTVVG